MPLLTRWRPASAAPYMEVALALPDIGRWYVFFLNSYSRLECTVPTGGATGPVQAMDRSWFSGTNVSKLLFFDLGQSE